MKKVLLLALITLLYTSAEAQVVRGAGMKIGATLSSQTWDSQLTDVDPDSRMGFNIGAFVEFLDAPFFTIVGEVNYIQKGLSNLEAQIAENLLDGDIRLNYLNFTALAKLRLNYIAFSPYLVAGPKLDIELNREAIANSLIINNFKKERLGFRIGLGTEINLQAFDFLIELLYDADFNELYNENNLSINTRSYDLRVGIMF
jgi:hypothetical protein